MEVRDAVGVTLHDLIGVVLHVAHNTHRVQLDVELRHFLQQLVQNPSGMDEVSAVAQVAGQLDALFVRDVLIVKIFFFELGDILVRVLRVVLAGVEKRHPAADGLRHVQKFQHGPAHCRALVRVRADGVQPPEAAGSGLHGCIFKRRLDFVQREVHAAL